MKEGKKIHRAGERGCVLAQFVDAMLNLAFSVDGRGIVHNYPAFTRQHVDEMFQIINSWDLTGYWNYEKPPMFLSVAERIDPNVPHDCWFSNLDPPIYTKVYDYTKSYKGFESYGETDPNFMYRIWIVREMTLVRLFITMYSFTNVDNFTNSYKGFRSYGERYLILDGPRNGPGWVFRQEYLGSFFFGQEYLSKRIQGADVFGWKTSVWNTCATSINTVNEGSDGKSENEMNNLDEERSNNTGVSILSMRGGDGHNSYATNSLLQRRVLSMSKPILVKNTKEMMTNLDFPKCIKISDLGCSSGQNTFLAMSEIVNTINELCQERNQNTPEIDCCLNDLPGNDFNTTFKFISFFNEKLTRNTPCFVSGVPGSFYSRLFPSKSLHFIHSNYSVNYPSKVPEGLEKNKMGVYITSSSPLSEYKAYLKQFQKDFTTFLRMRSEEMVSNGRMVITLFGRNTIDDPLYRDCCHHLTLLSDSLRDLVIEGLVSASTVNSFNMPFYDPTEEEVNEIIRNEGSFQINDLETHAFDLGHSKAESSLQSCRAKPGEKEANCVRAAIETMLVAHFGDAISIDTLFAKYAHHVSQHASCMNKTSVTLVVSLGNKVISHQLSPKSTKAIFIGVFKRVLRPSLSLVLRWALKPKKINLDREDLFFFFASVAVVVQPAMDDNNSVYVGGFPYDITDEALPYADKEIVYENSHGFERRGDDVLDRNGYKESFWRWRRRRLAWESGPTKNIKK
ncbi:hypothetical protein YC2023_066451 [Brassica napus]